MNIPQTMEDLLMANAEGWEFDENLGMILGQKMSDGEAMLLVFDKAVEGSEFHKKLLNHIIHNCPNEYGYMQDWINEQRNGLDLSYIAWMPKGLRLAKKEDFKVGTVLIDSEGNHHAIRGFYSDGIWETNNKCVFEGEAKFYRVKLNP